MVKINYNNSISRKRKRRKKDMEKIKIITIGREYASGGRSVGKLISEKLGIPFYNKEILKSRKK